jgi:hypothetical protein
MAPEGDRTGGSTIPCQSDRHDVDDAAWLRPLDEDAVLFRQSFGELLRHQGGLVGSEGQRIGAAAPLIDHFWPVLPHHFEPWLLNAGSDIQQQCP